jgi:hypothetical protein
MRTSTKVRTKAALIAGSLFSTMAFSVSPAQASVREVSGYLSCPAGQYIALRTAVNSSQTIEIRFGGRLQRTTQVSTFDHYQSRTPQAYWRVSGDDIETVSDFCYTPSGGPVL